ncbi:DUF3488 domain-containing protein, partial [Acinetobacter guillouiae]|nr:DUF3488 domain-containing protein [Acinetobacter guillouiae]
MNKSIQISILVVLILILLAQLAYMPVALSILFIMNIVALALYYDKTNKHLVYNLPRLFAQTPKLFFALLAL